MEETNGRRQLQVVQTRAHLGVELDWETVLFIVNRAYGHSDHMGCIAGMTAHSLGLSQDKPSILAAFLVLQHDHGAVEVVAALHQMQLGFSEVSLAVMGIAGKFFGLPHDPSVDGVEVSLGLVMVFDVKEGDGVFAGVVHALDLLDYNLEILFCIALVDNHTTKSKLLIIFAVAIAVVFSEDGLFVGDAAV